MTGFVETVEMVYRFPLTVI